MKKNKMTLLAVVLFAACSQEQTDIIQKEIEGDVTGIIMIADDFVADAQTRTVLTPGADGMQFTWADKDTVGIYPDRGDQVCFPISTGTDSNMASFDGGGWALKDASKYAAYYPFDKANYFRNNSSVLLKYAGQKQTANASTTHLGAYDFMAASAVAPKEGNVTFAFKHLNSVLQLKLTMPRAATFRSLALTTDKNVLTEEATLNLKSEPALLTTTKAVNTLILELENITTTANNQEITLYMMIPPVDLSGKELSAELLDSNGNSYSAALVARNFEAGKAYSFSATAAVSAATTDVTLSSAGTLLAAIGGYDNLRNIKKLKITGEINGDDVYEIRRMVNLEYLNLKDSKIVAGGRAYYQKYTTEEDVIVNNMFGGFKTIKQLILPDNIKAIGPHSLFGCEILLSIHIPEGVKKIDGQAFQLCQLLSSVDLPVGLETIGFHAFADCRNLSKIEIPATVRVMEFGAFDNCKQLREVHIKSMPTTLTAIGTDPFGGCYDKAVLYIPKGTRTAYQATELGRFATIIEE